MMQANYTKLSGMPGPRKAERGIALVFALLGILILSMLAASLMFITSTEVFASANYKSQMQANYAAVAGVQRAMDWFRAAYGPWLNTSAGATATDVYTLSGTSATYNGNPVTLGSGANFPSGTLADGNTVTADFDNIRTGTASLGNTSASWTITTASLISHKRARAPDGVTVRIMERWSMPVTGRVTGPLGDSVVQQTAVIQRIFIPLFSNAIRGQCDVQINGNVTTDSYYSTTGPYNVGGNIYTGPYAGSSIASNSFTGISGNSGVINGDVYYGSTVGACTGGYGINNPGTVQGQVQEAPGVPFPPITPTFTTGGSKPNDCASKSPYEVLGLPKGTPPTYAWTPNGPSSNNYHNCTLQAGEILQLRVPNQAAPVTFFAYGVDSRSTGAQIIVTDSLGVPCTSACAPIILYLSDVLGIGGGGVIGVTPCVPPNFTILYTGTAGAAYGGNAGYCGTIYAPYATLDLSGSGAIYGAVTAKNVVSSGDVVVHYDLALADRVEMVTDFRIVNQTRNVF